VGYLIQQMLRPSNCYAKLVGKADFLLHYCRWLILHADNWTEHFGFDAIELHRDVIDEEPVLAEVNKIQKIGKLGLLRVKSKSFYDWHVDAFRLSCINLLVSDDHHSHTLFGKKLDSRNREIIELPYEKGRYYIFNNQMEHCVCNLDEDRYLFSIYFEEEIVYEDLYQCVKSSKLLDEGSCQA